MTDPLPIRSLFSDAYLALMDRHPELHEAPHHSEHDACWLCATARRAFGYIRQRDRRGPFLGLREVSRDG